MARARVIVDIVYSYSYRLLYSGDHSRNWKRVSQLGAGLKRHIEKHSRRNHKFSQSVLSRGTANILPPHTEKARTEI